MEEAYEQAGSGAKAFECGENIERILVGFGFLENEKQWSMY